MYYYYLGECMCVCVCVLVLVCVCARAHVCEFVFTHHKNFPSRLYVVYIRSSFFSFIFPLF